MVRYLEDLTELTVGMPVWVVAWTNTMAVVVEDPLSREKQAQVGLDVRQSYQLALEELMWVVALGAIDHEYVNEMLVQLVLDGLGHP
jgi:hypothetical protein